MISVLTLGMAVPIVSLLMNDAGSAAEFCLRLERLLPRRAAAAEVGLVDEPSLARQLAADEACGRVAGECAKIPRQVCLIGVAAGICQLCPPRDLAAP